MTTGVNTDDIRAIMVTYVDHAGISRIKVVPGRRLASLERSGATASLSAATLFSTDDYPISTPALDAAIGDVRVMPDLERLVMLDPDAGLAWAPSDLRGLDGSPFPTCTRSALRQVSDEAKKAGLEVLIGLELEFSLFRGTKDDPELAHSGPGYGVLPFLELEALHLELLAEMERCGVPVEQVHPEYGNGQLELSFAPREPLTAVDDFILARTIVARVCLRHGFLVSFAPLPTPGESTNGLHIHMSATRDGRNVFHEPDAANGIAPEGAQMIAGVLASLGESIALLGGTTTSFARLQPHNWAGAYICWGDGNREAAVRLMRGFAGSENAQANIEVKCADGSSNLYLAVAAVLSAALRGTAESLALPIGVDAEPGSLSDEQRSELGVLPFAENLVTALDGLEASSFYRSVFGDVLLDNYIAVRRHDWATYGELPLDDAATASRWHY